MALVGRIGTRTEHFLAYISSVMDVLDRNIMKGQSLIMDNAPIHSPVKVRELMERRGYKCLHRPPYSSFLNRSEELLAKIKAGIWMNALRADDRLSNRIYESVGKVTRADCQGWIRHAVYFFLRVKMNKEFYRIQPTMSLDYRESEYTKKDIKLAIIFV
jgi:hypothetical protein